MRVKSRLWLCMFVVFLVLGGCWDGWDGGENDTQPEVNDSGDNLQDDPVVPDDPADPVSPVLRALVMGSAVMIPAFTADCHDYELSVGEGVATVMMSIETDDITQRISINGSESGIADFPREVSWDNEGHIIVKVISLSQKETEYRFNVVVKLKPDVPKEWHHESLISVPYGPGGMLLNGQGHVYVHMGHKLYRYANGELDSAYGTNGSSEILTAAGSDAVCIDLDIQGNVYVPTGSGGNVEKVLPSGVVEGLFRADDGGLADLGAIRSVVLNAEASIMWLVQSDGTGGSIRGIIRMEQQDGMWRSSDGKEGRSLWGVDGILSAKEFNGNMRSLVHAGDYLYLGLGSTSRRVYRIATDGGSISPVVDLSSSGENTGDTGSCGFLAADSAGTVYVPVLREATGEYSEIRMYRFDGSADILSDVIQGSLLELCIPGNNDGMRLAGLAVSSDGSCLWFGRSDETLHCIKLK